MTLNINESVEFEYTIPKIAENNFDEKEIEQYLHFNENIIEDNWENKCLAPTVVGYFFSCEYKIKIFTQFDGINETKIDIPIIINLSDDYFNKYKIKSEPEKELKFGSFIYIPSKKEKNKLFDNIIKEDKDKNIENEKENNIKKEEEK